MKAITALLVCLIFAALSAPVHAAKPVTALPVVVNNEPIILKGTQTLTIDTFDYTAHNNITLRDNSTLVIRNATFRHTNDYSWQFELNAYDNSKVIISNSTLTSGAWVIWSLWDSATIQLTNVVNNGSQIWHLFHENTAATASTVSRFYGTLANSASANVTNVPENFIEMVFPVDAIVDEAFPIKVAKSATYSFPNQNDSGVFTKLTMKNTGSSSSRWGITYVPTDDITIRNTTGLTVTFNIPYTFDGITAEFSGLRTGLYTDQTWTTGYSQLHLINTSTNPWSPIVAGNNTLIISDSDLSDNAFSYGTAKIYIYRSTLYSVRSMQYVNMYYYDCAISQDVVATENSIIELHNTTVAGQIVEEDSGQVVVTAN